jgi:glutaconyl-CoA/methylmalonyl-CoA decarboxylase subunit gamma
MDCSKMKILAIDDEKYKTLITTKFENRVPWKNPEGKKIFCVIPGTVINLLVNQGDKVEVGQGVLILEAMKMNNQFNSPFKGKVKKIHITEGQTIPKGFLMFEIE